jgi:glycosyltransferase involved in cell wall biosynthesis
MKVCLVSQEYPPETGWGGIGTQTFHKALGLTARGHEIHVVSTTWNGQPSRVRDGNLTVHRIAAPDLGALGYDPPVYWLAYSAAIAQKLGALGRETRFDVMQFPEYGGEGFVYQSEQFEYRDARYVVQLHSPLAMFADYLGWPRAGDALHQIGCLMESSVMQRADRLMASSHNIARFCAQHYGCSLADIEVIHSAVDTSRFRPRRQIEEGHHPRILFVGKLIKGKGIALLVKAVLQLRARYPRIFLRAVGRPDHDLFKQLNKMVARAEAQQSFQFTGNVPYAELPEHYRWCDFFVGPSTYEPGAANVYLEAMACGKPVIACNTGGAPEAVLDQQTGLLVPPGDVEALKQAITTLAEDKRDARRLGETGRAWVEERFSLATYVDRVERIYQEVISG